MGHAAVAAAHGDDLAARGEGVGARIGDMATAECGADGGQNDIEAAAHPVGTYAPPGRFRTGNDPEESQADHGGSRVMKVAAPVLLGLAACDAATVEPGPVQEASAATRGRAAIERAGCGACHAIPGVAWPRGRVGPPLHGVGDRLLIAGRLPNRPAILAAFLRDAPALVPETGMPPMPITEEEARDAAAYLATLRAR